MKTYMLLLLLLPLCTGQYSIKCYGHDFHMLNNEILTCSGSVEQACYTKSNGEKGCTKLSKCSGSNRNCCYTNLCNN